jgi:hypothetical protein
VRVFERKGCYPKKLENRLPVLVASDRIEQILIASYIAQEDFVKYTTVASQIVDRGELFQCL